MPLICPICRDKLDQGRDRNNNLKTSIIALKCGHLYHRQCIRKSFKSQTGQAKHGNCPTCDQQCSLGQARRIIPIVDSAGDSLSNDDQAELKRKVELLLQENMTSKQDLEILAKNLVSRENELRKSQSINAKLRNDQDILVRYLEQAEEQLKLSKNKMEMEKLRHENEALKENFKALRNHYKLYSPDMFRQ